MLDNTFDSDGILVVSSVFGEYANDITMDANGKILLAGTGVYGGSSNDNCLVMRINSNGTMDGTFGSGGKVSITLGSANEDGYGIAVDANGKIVIGGRTDSPNDEFVVFRLNTNGTLDNTFGSGGASVISVSSNDDRVRDLAIDGNGKILVAGFTGLTTATDFCVVRLNTDGSLDNTFGSAGKVITPVSVLADEANAIALDGSGNIIVAGSTTSSTSGNDFACIRLSPAGVIDNTFGSSGIATVSGNAAEAFNFKIDASGKIVLTGSGGSDFIAARLLTSSSTNLSEPFNEEKISVYPNPSAAKLNISVKNDIQHLKIYDNLGRLVFQNSFSGHSTVSLNIQDIPAGLYVIIVETSGGILSEKWIKE